MCFTLLIDYSLKRYFDPSNSDSLIFYPLKIKQKCQCVLWDSVALLQKKKKKRWLSTCKGHGIIWTREITKKLGWLLGGKYLHESTDFYL